jgi:ABC-type iron transport system FetAB ATPase subunit
MNAAPLFSARDLAVSRGGRRLVASFGLDLLPGECVALQAPSGGGKTSLLRVLGGLDDPRRGTLQLRGATPDELTWPVYRRRVQLVAQEPVLPAGTVGAALARPFDYRSAQGAFDPAAATELLAALFAHPPALTRDAAALSVGERQRVALARALLAGPSVLLLDEPTSALDPAATVRLEEAVTRHLRSAGAAALVVSHEPAQVSRWCGRSVSIGEGP